MIYANILKVDLDNLNTTAENLSVLLDKAKDLLSDKSQIHILQDTMKEIENLNIQFNQNLAEVQNIISATHYNKLSEIVIESSNDDLITTYNKTVHFIHQIHQKNKDIHSLLQLCQRLTENHINLLFGKIQQPTNYNFNKNNLNKHLLAQFKQSR